MERKGGREAGDERVDIDGSRKVEEDICMKEAIKVGGMNRRREKQKQTVWHT